MNLHNNSICLFIAAVSLSTSAADKEPQQGIAKAVIRDQPSATGLPPQTKGLADRAAHAFSKHDWPAARAAYKEMLALEPQNALAWANLGAVEEQAQQLDQAIACFEASTHFNSALIQSWTALGLIHAKRGDHYAAISALSRAVHENPLDAKVHNHLAIEFMAMGWRDAAVHELQRAIELDPDHGLAHFNLAAAYLDQKPPSRTLAQKHYDRARALGVEKDDVIERKLKP
jgi:tetratricopeptide (TPR) repeat protein